jgi:hypothetical protein
MNPSNLAFPCTLGDRIRDGMTEVEGVCAGFKIRSDGSKAVCIAWNAHGDPRYLWISDSRVTAGRSPAEIAADAARAATEAAQIVGNAASRQLTEDEAMDARQPEVTDEPARPRRRRRNAGEAEAQRREGEQQ